MWTPFIYAVVLILVFGGYLYLCEREVKVGKRIFLVRVREYFDRAIEKTAMLVARAVRYVVKYVITLSWYYSLHAFLKVAMRSLAGVYHFLESILIRNRDRARALRKERRERAKNHLSHIADHKAETKLTPAQAQKLKDKALKGH